MKNIFYYFFLLILICLLQVVIFNNINFLGYINPYIYIYFILIFPIQGNKFCLLFLSFILGFFIDHFMNTKSLHTFSITFLAYLRLNILKFIIGKNISYKKNFSIYKLSFYKQFSFVFLIALLHSQIIFFLIL